MNFNVNMPACNFSANDSSLLQFSIVILFGKFFVANTMKRPVKAMPQIILMTVSFSYVIDEQKLVMSSLPASLPTIVVVSNGDYAKLIV